MTRAIGNPPPVDRWTVPQRPVQGNRHWFGDSCRESTKNRPRALPCSFRRARTTAHRRFGSVRRANGRETKCHRRNDPDFSR